jgi:hypothetical protein
MVLNEQHAEAVWMTTREFLPASCSGCLAEPTSTPIIPVAAYTQKFTPFLPKEGRRATVMRIMAQQRGGLSLDSRVPAIDSADPLTWASFPDDATHQRMFHWPVHF